MIYEWGKVEILVFKKDPRRYQVRNAYSYSLCLFFLNLFFNNHMESFFFAILGFYIATVTPSLRLQW